MIEKYQQLVVDKANQYGIDPDLALRVVKQESGFNPNAVSKAGAGGLMQLMPGTAKDLGLSEQDRFNPEKNVDAGMRYLSKQINDFGDVGLGLAAYNAGPGNVRKAGNQIPQFKETQNYVASIMGDKQFRLPQSAVPKTAQEVVKAEPQQVESFDSSVYDRQLGRLEALRQQELADTKAAREELMASWGSRDAPAEENFEMVKIDIPQLKSLPMEAFQELAKRSINGSPRLKFGV